MKKHIRIINMIITSFLIIPSLKACTIALTNDTECATLVMLKNEPQVLFIGKNKTKIFGNDKEHANFDVFSKNKGVYKGLYNVTQTECGKTKQINLKMSDIQKCKIPKTPAENEKTNLNLFTVTPLKNQK